MILPAIDYQRCTLKKPEKPSSLDTIFVQHIGKKLNTLFPTKSCSFTQAVHCCDQSLNFQNVPDAELKRELKIVSEQNSCRILAGQRFFQAMTILVEVAHRTVGLRPFPTQIQGATALQRGNIVEMATGEGKTLMAGLAAVFWGWSRKPCHIITVNDYLAHRDATALKPFYQFCGLSVGWISDSMPQRERRRQYKSDIVYVTNKELLADFLRDRLQMGTTAHSTIRAIRHMVHYETGEHKLVLRGLHTAIVDEADSVLIDEAVTPLILSEKYRNQDLETALSMAHSIAKTFSKGVDFTVDPDRREIHLTKAGLKKSTASTHNLPGIWQNMARRREIIELVIAARELYIKGVHYIVESDKIRIVDPCTGRIMLDRTWKHGLQQAIEAWEGLPFTPLSESVSQMSFQNFFQLFSHLCGMTGTAREAAVELHKVYGLSVEYVAPHKQCRRRRLPNHFFASHQEKWQAIAAKISVLYANGQPVLVGTGSIAASERLSSLLAEHDIRHNLLNAHHHKKEAEIIAQAGQVGMVTIATNMAGRGTDILLGPGASERGGLFVLATEFQESRRIDRQLFGRCARQGDPGTVQVFACLDDDLFCRFLPGTFRALTTTIIRRMGPASSHLLYSCVALAQKRARRRGRQQRQLIQKQDQWLKNALPWRGL